MNEDWIRVNSNRKVIKKKNDICRVDLTGNYAYCRYFWPEFPLSEKFFYEHLVKGFLLSNQLPEEIPDRVFLPFLPKTYVAHHLD